MSFPKGIGDIEKPSKWKIEQEHLEGGHTRELNGHWKGGLATDNYKEYMRQWYLKNKHHYKKGGKYWNYTYVKQGDR